MSSAVGTVGVMDKMWTAAEVAAFLKVSRDWVYKRVTEGSIPFVKLPTGLTRYHPEQIRAYARGEWKPPQKVVPFGTPIHG